MALIHAFSLSFHDQLMATFAIVLVPSGKQRPVDVAQVMPPGPGS